MAGASVAYPQDALAALTSNPAESPLRATMADELVRYSVTRPLGHELVIARELLKRV